MVYSNTMYRRGHSGSARPLAKICADQQPDLPSVVMIRVPFAE